MLTQEKGTGWTHLLNCSTTLAIRQMSSSRFLSLKRMLVQSLVFKCFLVGLIGYVFVSNHFPFLETYLLKKAKRKHLVNCQLNFMLECSLLYMLTNNRCRVLNLDRPGEYDPYTLSFLGIDNRGLNYWFHAFSVLFVLLPN